jgi:REP element-mobilizing transposase RayT
MGSTYISLHYHLVFSTKERHPFIGTRWEPELWGYLGGTVRGLDGVAESIGVVEDHVHLLVSLGANHQVGDFLRELKKASSKWAARNHCREFAWQEGYAAFTVSAGHLKRVCGYIESQREHHRAIPFIDELRQLLRKNGVSYDPRFLE